MNFADAAPSGHIAFTDDGVLAYANAEALALLGYDSLEHIRVDALMTVATKVFHQTHLFPLLRLQKRADEVFLSLKSKSGDELPVLVNGKRVETETGAVNHLSFIVVRQRKKFEDELVRARRNAEEALHKNEQLLRIKSELESSKAALDRHLTRVEQKRREQLEYSAVISHDLNEPMRKIMIFADQLLHLPKTTLDERAMRALSRITEASARMRRLMDVLNEFLTVDAVEKTISNVDLNDALKTAEQQVRDAHLNVPWTLNAERLPAVEGVTQHFETLVRHLLDNAVKFRDPQRALVVNVTSDLLQDNRYQMLSGEYRYVDKARITVSDNGLGFDERYNEKVFQLFQKLHDDSSSLGYGLALCRKIVMNHYGKISANGKEGEGTAVTFTLPVSIS